MTLINCVYERQKIQYNTTCFVGALLAPPRSLWLPRTRCILSWQSNGHKELAQGDWLGLALTLCNWKQFYTSSDRSVWQEVLLCNWKRFYASLDRCVRLEMLLCSWKRFYASLDGSVQLEMLLCSWKRFYASLDGSVRLEMLLCSWKRLHASLTDLCNWKCS